MKKTTAKTPKKTNSKSPPQQIQNASMEAALGVPSGFPGNQGTPWSKQISNVTTVFENLRWYLVSNMRQPLSEAYVELGLLQSIVDVPVDDALQGGIVIKSKQLEEDDIEQIQVSLDRDDDLTTIGQSGKWNRLFGGAGVIIVTDQDPSTPLDLSLITKDSMLEFNSCDMWELFWSYQNTSDYATLIDGNPLSQVEFYDYYGIKLHKSRVLPLRGLQAPSFVRPRLRGWGFSVVEKLVRSINQYLKATDLGFEVMDEFKIDVFKLKNLANTLLSPNGEDKIRRRVQTTNYLKNYQNAIVMDSEDDFDHKQLSFAGLAEAMEGIRMQVAADMRMPITKLFGTSASKGFSTDQNDMEVYNSMVESEVRSKLKHIILKVVQIKCQKLFGMIPSDLSIEFKPLRTLTAEQEENVKEKKFNRLLAAKSAGEITTFEFREACNKEDLLSISLDNSGDQLNMDDPDIEATLAKTEDPLAQTDQGGDKGSDEIDPKVAEKKAEKKQNSLEYDIAAYRADGAGDQFITARQRLYEDEMMKRRDLYEKAKQATLDVGGDWKFTVWKFKQLGGRVYGA